jgi:cysteine-rich repeat protein
MSRSWNVRPCWTELVRSALVAALSVLLGVGGALAGDECQEIQLDGIAGGSGSTVVIRVVDASPQGMADPAVTSADIISTSCALSVPPLEPAATFIRRIPSFWGDGLGGTPVGNPTVCGRKCTAGLPPTTSCTSNSECDLSNHDGLGVCGVQEKKECGNTAGSGRSCTIEAKISQAKGKCVGGSSAGKGCSSNLQCPGGTCPGWDVLQSCEDSAPDETCTKKRTLKICCKATPQCSGAKLAGDGDNIPITVQTQITEPEAGCPGNEWCPIGVPGTNTQALRFKVDPIDGRPGPYGVQRECRASLQSATGAVTQAVFSVLKDCHRKVMAGQLPSGSCATVNATSDPGNQVANASAALHTALNQDCDLSGKSPSDFGYDNCPAPCGAIDLAKCSAGMVGSACQRNRHCDTTPGAGDGVCGAWNDVADCAVCGASAAGQAAITASYGSAGPDASVPSDAQNCQNHIGDDIGALLTVELKDAAACQRSLDRFKIMLSDRTPKCKDADHKRKRAKARASIAADLTVACNNTVLGQLDTCASKMAGLADCIPRIARRVTAVVSDAGAPEGRCGDGRRGIGEKCDDGNVIDGDGCDSNCTLTGCGNEIVTGGEECDDGNQVSGDGCGPGCVAEPCGPQMCGAYTFDCSTNFPGDCVCLHAAEGQGTCVSNFDCATATPCSSSLQCASNERCYLETCCGPPGTGVCGPKGCSAQ